jgi:hypothetical protein
LKYIYIYCVATAIICNNTLHEEVMAEGKGDSMNCKLQLTSKGIFLHGCTKTYWKQTSNMIRMKNGDRQTHAKTTSYIA